MNTTDENLPVVTPKRGPVRFVLFLIFGFLVPAAVILVGLHYARIMLASSPEAKRKPPRRTARLVEVEPIRFGKQTTRIPAMGTVRAARTLTVHARVGGEVKARGDGLVPGGRLGEGDLVVSLDATDYEIAEAQRATDVSRVESDLALERGQQSVALREFELLGEDVTPEEKALVLRKPQLAAIEARLAAAKAALRRATLDRKRCVVTAPFPALVRERHVDVGSQISAATPIAEIVGTEEYWVEVSIPVDRLRWIRTPTTPGEAGSTVTIRDEAAWGPDRSRSGEVLRLLGDLEPQGRMARLLVSVRDPLALRPENSGQPKLLLGAYVRATILGRDLPSVAAIRRDRIRGSHHVWLLTKENRLAIRPVEIVFRTEDSVYVTNGVAPGERLILTDLSAPVSGMLLRTGAPSGDGPGKGKGPGSSR